MSDVNRQLKLLNTRQSDDQYVADSDDSVSTHSDAPRCGDELAAAAESHSRACDAYVVAVATSSSSGGDDNDENECNASPEYGQQLQHCGPGRAYYTLDTDGHRHLEEAEKAGMPYSLLKDVANGEDCDDEDDDDEHSDSGGGQFGYGCNRSGGYQRPGYGHPVASNGHVDGIVVPAQRLGATEMASFSAAGGSVANKQHQKSDSPPESTGAAAAAKSAASDRAAKPKRQQQQQQSRPQFYSVGYSADPEFNEHNMEPLHYDEYRNSGAQPSSKNKRGVKRREQGVRTTIKAQDVAGNRGHDDIDSLLDFIESNPGARGKRGMSKPTGQMQMQYHLLQQQQKQKKPKDAKAPFNGPADAAEEAQQQQATSSNQPFTFAPASEVSQLQPLLQQEEPREEEQPLAAPSLSPTPQPQQLSLSEQHLQPEQQPQSEQQEQLALPVAQKTQQPAEDSPVDTVTLSNGPSTVPNGGCGSSVESALEPRRPQAQMIFTDFDTLSAPEPAREAAFSVVLSKKERKHKRRQADPQPPHSQHHTAHLAQHPPQHQQLQQHRQSSAHSAPPRVHNGGHAPSVPATAAAPSVPVSGPVALRTSSSSRSESPSASEASASASKPRPLNPAQYEQLLLQKAQENALLRRDLDSCSPNHSQLISFLYSLC